MPTHALASELIDLLKAIQTGTYSGPGADQLNAGLLLPQSAQQHSTLPDVSGYLPGQFVVVPDSGMYVAVGEPGTSYGDNFAARAPGGFDGAAANDGSGLHWSAPAVNGAQPIIRNGGLQQADAGERNAFAHLPVPHVDGKVSVVIKGKNLDDSTNGGVTVIFDGLQPALMTSGGYELVVTNSNGGYPYGGDGSTIGSGGSFDQFGYESRALGSNPPELGEDFVFTVIYDPSLYGGANGGGQSLTYVGPFGTYGPLTVFNSAVGGYGWNGGLDIAPLGDNIVITSVELIPIGTLRWNKVLLEPLPITWTALTLTTGTVVADGAAGAERTPSYRHEGAGFVHCTGYATGLTGGDTVATLPAGSRPDRVEHFEHVYIKPTGDIIVTSLDNAGNISLAGISFLAAQ